MHTYTQTHTYWDRMIQDGALEQAFFGRPSKSSAILIHSECECDQRTTPR
uniref:Bm14689 n=1 Tax=Brugia malayi TaxID=6279 RepID=A0A1I9G1R6_BRUMA|nr:Bm14689 [Brugia malayi]